jgi:thiol-disulfide isomerase/thioredoxin
VVCLVVLAAGSAFGLSRRRRDGRLTGPGPGAAPRGQAAGGQAAGRQQLGSTQLGQPLGQRATLLQFSSEFCAPCRATRKILEDVASEDDGVRHVEVDAADRMDLVRLLDVRRTPTVFVLGPDGRVARRGSGLMRREDVLAALGELR